MTTQEDRRFGGDHHSWKPLTICLATKASTGKFTHKSRHTDGLVAREQHASVSKPFRQEGRRQWHPCNFARVETGKFIDPTYVYTPPASNHYCFWYTEIRQLNLQLFVGLVIVVIAVTGSP
jgi:hypothetical protein